jgi:ParB-like chromosome segregation protein Spo0J
MRMINANQLVFDQDLYPRGEVDKQNVTYIVRALEAGKVMPPIVIDKASKRIVDGIHRWHAHRQYAGDETVQVECIEKSYKSDAELFLDAAQLNASHGQNLTMFDRTRCVMIAQRLHIPDNAIAGALNMTQDKVGAMKQERTGYMRSANGRGVTSFTKDRIIPLKRSIRHMAGRLLTQKQAEANEKLSGMDAIFHVLQLLTMIDNDLLDLSDARLRSKLVELSDKIRAMFLPVKKAK